MIETLVTAADRGRDIPRSLEGARMLVAYANDSSFVATTYEYLESFAKHSTATVRYVHVTHGVRLDFDLNEFDIVFQNYCARLIAPGYVGTDFLDRMRTFDGLKLLAVQDEYEYTDRLHAAIQEIGYHIVFTCVPQQTITQVYPPEKFPNTEFVNVLTGYVPEAPELRQAAALPLAQRPIMVGYRGRDIGPRYGRLAFDKLEIGRRMREICRARNVAHDIEWTEESRIYGAAWYGFIGSCRAVLGSESGSNVFDFDGSVAAKWQKLAAAQTEPVSYAEFSAVTDPIEAKFDAGQISPRVFEAAALRTPMILYKGRYSGIVEPDTHYIELQKDFSNVDQVLKRLDDIAALERMAERAHDDLIASGQFSYRRFTGLIESAAARKATELGLSPWRSRPGPLPPEPRSDPQSLKSMSELPTGRPRHVVHYHYKAQTSELENIKAYVTTLVDEIARLNEVYPVEIDRLVALYTAEIARLNDFYPAEIARLNQVYPAEIARLNAALVQRRSGVSLRIRRAIKKARTDARRLVAPVAMRLDLVRSLLENAAARSIIRRCAARPLKGKRFLVEVARLIQASGATADGKPVALVPWHAGDEVEIRALPHDVAAGLHLCGESQAVLSEARASGLDFRLAFGPEIDPRPHLTAGDMHPLPGLRWWLQQYPDLVTPLILGAPGEPTPPTLPTSTTHYFEFLSAATRYPDLAPLLHSIDRRRLGREPAPPYDRPRPAPPTLPAEPRRRSVLFLHQSYYNFKYLAEALQRRGWDAFVLNLHPPTGPDAKFFHGEDLNLYDPDYAQFLNKAHQFFDATCDRFGIVHSYGMGTLSLFTVNWDNDPQHSTIPWDILEWRRRGILIGYTHTGCLDGVAQSTFRRWSPTSCARCTWVEHPDICSDMKNLTWGRKLEMLADLICVEADAALDFNRSPKAFRDPLTMALDPNLWRPNLEPPEALRRPRRGDDEIRVYHGVGNYRARTKEGVNIKGTHAVVAAIDALRDEGIPIRLDFVENVPSIDNRFIQAQADIIVDQLNYGRYGAIGREGMMLGKPVVARINPWDAVGVAASACILETPIVNADEDTIKDVLRDLALDPAKRAEIGGRSREHALKWWSADRLAERFEQVYDTIRDTGRPPRTLDA